MSESDFADSDPTACSYICARCGKLAEAHEIDISELDAPTESDIAYYEGVCDDYQERLCVAPPFHLVSLGHHTAPHEVSSLLRRGLAVYHPGFQTDGIPNWSYRYDVGVVIDWSIETFAGEPTVLVTFHNGIYGGSLRYPAWNLWTPT